MPGGGGGLLAVAAGALGGGGSADVDEEDEGRPLSMCAMAAEKVNPARCMASRPS